MLDVHKILLARNFLGAVFPVLDFGFLSFEGNHLKCLFAFLSGANVNAVAAAEAVEHANLLAEVHTLHCLRCKHFERCSLEACNLLVGHYERAYASVRANECTLVALDTVIGIPNRNECSHTTFFVCRSALFPCAVFEAFVSRNRQEVSVLCINRTYNVGDEFRLVAYNFGIVWKVCPCRVDVELLVFYAAVYCLVVLVYHVLAFLTV